MAGSQTADEYVERDRELFLHTLFTFRCHVREYDHRNSGTKAEAQGYGELDDPDTDRKARQASTEQDKADYRCGGDGHSKHDLVGREWNA